jgi:hypothetical protein
MLLRMRRPLRIATAYVGACLVSGLLLATIIVAKLPDTSAREVLPGLFGATIAMARVSGIVGLLPSIVVIAILEWRAERRWIIYAVFGAILAIAASFIVSDALAAPRLLDMAAVAGGAAALGIASASVYWWIAGRQAGRSRPPREAINGSA